VTLTPRLVNMVAIFVAAASAAANNNKNNNYSGKLKRKTATTSKFIPKMGNDTSGKLKGHRGVATHSLEPCKVSLPGLKRTQHKLHTNCTLLVSSAPS